MDLRIENIPDELLVELKIKAARDKSNVKAVVIAACWKAVGKAPLITASEPPLVEQARETPFRPDPKEKAGRA